MRTILLSHNKTAYQKVMRAFETADRTCVVHPTGTGKSYLIAAISELFKKVLILGPNTFVLDQVHSVLKWRKRGVEYMTYQTLNLTENPHTDYDLICLDEFHRTGAPEWGAAVDRLLELNTEAKVFGTTATHIRYLDNERNMADELFHGNIASYITIAEAWNQSILPIPRYVSGLFRWDKTVSDAQERIERSRSLSDKEKRKRIFRLSNAKLRWELSYGMPTILKKHLDKDARRVIVFCGNIESLEQMRDEVVGWFREAGFTVASTCIMHSDLTDREQREQMDRFEDDTDGKGVKLMFSVNMLNEGIHVPNVNAVLMLRTTSSRIIYMQQMGRCLTAANTAKPLVLDMVDNITTTTAIKGLLDEFDAIEIPQAEREDREPRKFEVKDYTLGVKNLIEKLSPRELADIPFEEHIAIMQKFCEEHNRQPRTNELPIYRHWAFINLTEERRQHPAVKALRDKYIHPWEMKDYDERIKSLTDFCETHQRFPRKGDDAEEVKNWARVYNKYQTDGRRDQRITDLLYKYSSFMTDDMLVWRIVEFEKQNHRLPSHGNNAPKYEKKMRQQLAKRKHLHNRPEIAALLEQYTTTRTTLDERLQMVEAFCKTHNRRPVVTDGKIMNIWSNCVIYKDDPRVKALLKQYPPSKHRMNDEELRDYIQPVIDYINRHHAMPSAADNATEESKEMFKRIRKLGKMYDSHPLMAEVRRLRSLYGRTFLTVEQSIQMMQDYTDKHGCIPPCDDAKMRRIWINMVRNGKNDPRVVAMSEKYGKPKN